MAGGTARPAAAEGEAGHEPGTGWPGRRWLCSGEARAHGRPKQARHMVNPRCRDAVPLFRDHFVRPSNRRKRRIAHCYGVSQTCPDVLRRIFRGFCTVFGFSLFGRVGVIPGLVNGTASTTRAPCRQSPEPPFVLRGQKTPFRDPSPSPLGSLPDTLEERGAALRLRLCERGCGRPPVGRSSGHQCAQRVTHHTHQ